MGGNIFRIDKITAEQTINVNRFSIRFLGLNEKLLTVAPASPLWGVQKRYQAVRAALGTNPEESLEIGLVSASHPAITLGIADLPKFNDVARMVTKFDPLEPMTVSFLDYVNGSASAIMLLWHAFVGDKRTGAIGFKQDFVLPKAELYCYGPDAPGYEVESPGEIPYLQKYEIINLFPTQVKPSDFTSENADPRRVEVTFYMDNIYPVEIFRYDYTAADPTNRYTNVPADLGNAALPQ
jgi:hypothetical protein